MDLRGSGDIFSGVWFVCIRNRGIVLGMSLLLSSCWVVLWFHSCHHMLSSVPSPLSAQKQILWYFAALILWSHLGISGPAWLGVSVLHLPRPTASCEVRAPPPVGSSPFQLLVKSKGLNLQVWLGTIILQRAKLLYSIGFGFLAACGGLQPAGLGRVPVTPVCIRMLSTEMIFLFLSTAVACWFSLFIFYHSL